MQISNHTIGKDIQGYGSCYYSILNNNGTFNFNQRCKSLKSHLVVHLVFNGYNTIIRLFSLINMYNIFVFLWTTQKSLLWGGWFVGEHPDLIKTTDNAMYLIFLKVPMYNYQHISI